MLAALKKYISNRFTLFNLALCLLAIYGVAFLDWNPARILTFYWVDVCIFLLFFLLYMKWAGHLYWYAEIVVGYFILMLLMLAFLVMLIGFSDNLGYDSVTNWNCKDCDIFKDKLPALFYPYYDFSFYISLAALANAFLLLKIKRAGGGPTAYAFYMNISAWSILSVPVFLFISALISVLTALPMHVSAVLWCFISRFLFDLLQQHYLRRILPVQEAVENP